MSLLVDVQRKMQLYSRQKVRTILDGEYGSVFKGRSMDFDDLREYVAGDDVKDIDWKATARSRQVLIKRYIAVRKHNVLLAVDTGKNMAATSPVGSSKRDISVFVSGILASIVLKHADLIGIVSGDDTSVRQLPLRGNTTHVERILQRIHRSTSLNASYAANLVKLLDYITRTQRRRLMVIVISDRQSFTSDEYALFRRLRAQHEVMYICIKDGTPFDKGLQGKDTYDINEPLAVVPRFFQDDVALQAAITAELDVVWQETTRQLNRLAISHVEVDSDERAVEAIISLLERQKHVRSR